MLLVILLCSNPSNTFLNLLVKRLIIFESPSLNKIKKKGLFERNNHWKITIFRRIYRKVYSTIFPRILEIRVYFIFYNRIERISSIGILARWDCKCDALRVKTSWFKLDWTDRKVDQLCGKFCPDEILWNVFFSLIRETTEYFVDSNEAFRGKFGHRADRNLTMIAYIGYTPVY